MYNFYLAAMSETQFREPDFGLFHLCPQLYFAFEFYVQYI